MCYLISKNLYSLQNAQPFIFQLICMQLCKYFNCFIKAHNKQLNQYCLNFILFFLNGLGSGRVRLTCKIHGSSHRSICFCFRSNKIGFESGIFRVRSSRIRMCNKKVIPTESPPIIAPNYEEANKESINSIPISVIMLELIDIQVREINEASMTNG